MAKTLRFRENEAFTLTVTVKRNGAAIDVGTSVYDTVTLQIHDNDAAAGTDWISLAGTPDADQVNNKGKVYFVLTQTLTAFPAGKTEFRGKWTVFCKKTDNTLKEWTDDGECIVAGNPYVAI